MEEGDDRDVDGIFRLLNKPLYDGREPSDGAWKSVGFAIFRSLILVGLDARFSFEICGVPDGCGMLNGLLLFVMELSLGGLKNVGGLVPADGLDTLLKRLPPLSCATESLAGLG